MKTRFFFALAFVAAAALGSTQYALAFDPTRDELLIGTFIGSLILMVVLGAIYALVTFLGLNKMQDVDIPDHAHDHRYADHH
jgi:hypothetical protein